LIGAQYAVLAGGIAIAAGNAMLALSTTPRGFYVGLVVIVVGVGLLKPNVSAIVAGLYPEGGARLDSGFTIFYIGINVGAFLGPLITGEAQVLYGARAGFGVAALFMGFGALQFLLTRRHLGSAGAYSPPDTAVANAVTTRSRHWTRFWVGAAASALVLGAVSFGLIPVDAVRLAARDVQRLADAHGNENFVLRPVAGGIIFFNVMADGAAQFDRAEVRGVMRLAFFQRIDAGLPNVPRRVKIRFAHPQRDGILHLGHEVVKIANAGFGQGGDVPRNVA